MNYQNHLGIVALSVFNTTTDSFIRAGLQRHGRLAHPLSQPVHASTPAYNKEDNLLVRTVLQHCSRLICLFPAAHSLVIDFSFTMVIINSVVDNFWPDILGEIHPVYFYITYYFL